MTLSLII